MDEYGQLLKDIHTELGDIKEILQQQLDGVREWKGWDKKHHAEEIENRKLLTELIKGVRK